VKFLFRALLVLLPWPIRRRLLIRCFGFSIDKTSRIGLAWVFPKELVLEPYSAIGHLTFCVNLDRIHLHAHATIGRGNWITGFPTGTDSPHFQHETNRRAELNLEEHAAITNRHFVDCTAEVVIGRFSTFAGFASQILTHSVDLERNRQSSRPVVIGQYCFIGTNCVILGGARLPDYSVLAAKSLLQSAPDVPYGLYGGIPARFIKELPRDYAYFSRERGYVD
jgi:acetyltransferase-like isoleucine patch superfamily enzyme